MKLANAAALRTLSMAGKDIRLTLKRIYGGPEGAEKAIRKLADDTEALEQWATITSQEVFTFDGMSPPMREAAVLSMAAAMLVWNHEQERAA